MLFTIQLAEINIQIETYCARTEEYFIDYLTLENPQYSIKINRDRFKAEEEILKNQFPNRSFEDFEIENNALYRDLPQILLKEDIVLIHGVLISYNDRGYIFTAPSGIGKSTHARLWKELYGDRVTIINGDKPLLKLTKDGVKAYGSPWMGKEKIGVNTSVQLCGICNLHRNIINTIEKVEFDWNSINWLLEQTQVTSSENTIIDRVRWFKKAIGLVPLYVLNCDISADAVRVASSILVKDK